MRRQRNFKYADQAKGFLGGDRQKVKKNSLGAGL